ncbi:MAG: alkyl sulfatase dimerization domain-containing protein [Acidimicrobiales bacterium]
MTSATDPFPKAGPEALGESRVEQEAREIAPGVFFLAGFGNTTILIGSEGAAIVDPGLFTNGPRVVRELRQLTDLPVRYVIYTHGHYDHAFGTPAIMKDAAARGHDAPDIVGHVNVVKRFERYAKTAGHLAGTFDAQFAIWGPGGGDVVRNAKYFPPTIAYEDRLLLDGLGDLLVECRHGLGETDDHTWVWVPGARVIVGGDFIVSSLPNAGTPFRVQRYVLEWAEALEEMAAVEPLSVVSGHGGVFGDHAQEMLLTTATALRYLDSEVVRRLNEGQWQEQILAEVELPDELAASSYLQPLYGCTAFAVRDIMRRYMGWYDGNPSMIFPSSRVEVATEIVALTGGTAPVMERARVLGASEETAEIQRALHLVDFVIFNGGDQVDEAHALKAELLDIRSKRERSFVAHNILASAAVIERESGSTA